jgi:hypothetical protein
VAVELTTTPGPRPALPATLRRFARTARELGALLAEAQAELAAERVRRERMEAAARALLAAIDAFAGWFASRGLGRLAADERLDGAVRAMRRALGEEA